MRWPALPLISYTLLCLGGALLLHSCTPRKAKIQLPMTIRYTVHANDSGALYLVNTYYAERFEYTMYDSSRFSSRRSALIGDVEMWYDGRSLRVRESNGGYCSCAEVSGAALDFYRSSFDPPNVMMKGQAYDLNGQQVNDAFFVRDETDTTWLTLSTEWPNLWFDLPWIPALPLTYAYRLKNDLVQYTAQEPAAASVEFNANDYDTDCVRIPAVAWVGAGPESEVAKQGNTIWMYGYLIDEEENLLSGTLTVIRKGPEGERRASMKLDQGSYDLELLRGYDYTLEFTAPNMVRKRLDIDCRKVPDTPEGYALDINVALFESQVYELKRYLETTSVLAIAYWPDSAGFVVNKELAERAAKDLELMRSREGNAGRRAP